MENGFKSGLYQMLLSSMLVTLFKYGAMTNTRAWSTGWSKICRRKGFPSHSMHVAMIDPLKEFMTDPNPRSYKTYNWEQMKPSNQKQVIHRKLKERTRLKGNNPG